MIDRTDISFVTNSAARVPHQEKTSTSVFSPESARAARRFHRTLPGYAPTPLVRLPGLAGRLGVAELWVKDESKRFGLKAFKVLGASYAVATVLAQRLGLDPDKATFKAFAPRQIRKQLRKMTVCTATDGNHGRAVAWAAEQLGCSAVVYMPRGTVAARFEAVASHGADVSLIDANYDGTVRRAAEDSGRNGWLLVQDTAWAGYEAIPLRIMQGYLSILDEALEQLRGEIPTHVLVQVGVGSLAGALLGQLNERMGEKRPMFAVVEPTQAACCFASMAAGTRDPRSLEGDLQTIMAGLACGTPSTVAWDILRDYADVFVACSDAIAACGMCSLARPVGGDPRIVSGESGAITVGLLATLLEPEGRGAFSDAVSALRITESSRVLVISTEGDTDPDSYQTIVRGSVRSD
jgi:diaminopropionate ammonia-lyase